MKSFILLLSLFLVLSCTTSKGSLHRDKFETDKKESSKPEKRKDSYDAPSPDPFEYDEPEEIVGLSITSYPTNVEVYLNNRYRGKTPLFLEDLPQGFYHLKLVKKGYYNYEDTINFYDDYQQYRAYLDQITGTLQVDVDVPQAIRTEILVGDKIIRPNHPVELPIGRYSVLVRAFGYESYRTSVLISERQQAHISASLGPVEFALSSLEVGRPRFNPINPGLLGKTWIRFRVNSWGSGTATITDVDDKIVYQHSLPPFDTWEQSFQWNGRGPTGPLPDGTYTVTIEADSEDGGSSEILSTAVTIDSTLWVVFRSLWSGGSGLMYCPSPDTLPSGSLQLSTLLLGFVELLDDRTLYTFPWNLGLRVGLGKRTELDVEAGVQIEHDSGSGETFTPITTSAALKVGLWDTIGTPAVSSSALIKASYQNTTTDTLANFTGLSAGMPVSFRFGQTVVLLSPEIIMALQTVSYTSSSRDGVFAWLYGRAGVLVEIGSFILGGSVSLRSLPFNQGFGLDLPLQAALEVHWLIPETQFNLSFSIAGEFAGWDNYYLMSGGGLGLLN